MSEPVVAPVAADNPRLPGEDVMTDDWVESCLAEASAGGEEIAAAVTSRLASLLRGALTEREQPGSERIKAAQELISLAMAREDTTEPEQ
jgi:hypothetical protein